MAITLLQGDAPEDGLVALKSPHIWWGGYAGRSASHCPPLVQASGTALFKMSA